MKAIETIFDGYRFRSRLEARWAVFFKTLGIEYHYEVEGFNLDGIPYLPDFWLPEQECWVEIKGEHPKPREDLMARLLALTLNKEVYLFHSPIWIPGIDDTYKHDRYGGGEVIETIKKGAYCFDPSDVSLTVDDTASPCYHAGSEKREKDVTEESINSLNTLFGMSEEGTTTPPRRIFRQVWYCKACGKEKCDAHLEIYPPGTEDDENYGDIHLTPEQEHLIRAVYIAEALSSYGDSCKLRLDQQGKLQYLVPRYQGKQYQGRTPASLPSCIQAHQQEFENLLAYKPNTYEWGMGTIGLLYSEDIFRWCECPICHKFGITVHGKTSQLPCYEYHSDDEMWRIENRSDEKYVPSDRTPRLIAAYTAARQARFEYGR